jgi:hypothetical protein
MIGTIILEPFLGLLLSCLVLSTGLGLTEIVASGSGEKQNAINLLDKGLVISPQNTAFIMARAQLYLQEKIQKALYNS